MQRTPAARPAQSDELRAAAGRPQNAPGQSHPAPDGADVAPGGGVRFGERLRRVGAGIRWYVTNLMGDTAYQVYLDHHNAHHPGEAPLTERQFWREKMDEQDRNPGARCC